MLKRINCIAKNIGVDVDWFVFTVIRLYNINLSVSI